MKYYGYMPNDFINGENISVSLWTAGCPHRCKGCHNSEMWNYENGYEVPIDIKGQLIKAISANGLVRNFSILGGEPLSEKNRDFILTIVQAIRTAYPSIKIFLWTGYTIEELKNMEDKKINSILENIDVLIDGKYDESLRDVTLELRGSSNQRILKRNIDF